MRRLISAFGRAPVSPLARLAAAAGAFAVFAIVLTFAAPVSAEERGQATRPSGVVVAAQTLRPGVVLDTRHVALVAGQPGPGDLTELRDVIGLETQVAVYRGHAIRVGDLGPPTLIQRNELVRISFKLGGLTLETEGRALDDGAMGQRVRVMNLDSRRTIYGHVAGPGLVETSQ